MVRLNVTGDPRLVGVDVYAQGLLFGNTPEGGLTNPLRLRVGG